MWVDIANLMGPRGEPGDDGQPGAPGPINIGLNPDEPIAWDQTGGFTFQFIDGSEQTVNLPIASAQSAGLQAAADAFDSGWRDLIGYAPDTASGALRGRRRGYLVEIAADGLKLPGVKGTRSVIDPIGSGWRPTTSVYFNSVKYWSNTSSISFRVWVDSSIQGVMGSSGTHEVSFHVAYLTSDAPPTVLPGDPA